jgi:hypothetical protein
MRRNRARITTGRWTRVFNPDLWMAVYQRTVKLTFLERPGRPQKAVTVRVNEEADAVSKIDLKSLSVREGVMAMVKAWMDEVGL